MRSIPTLAALALAFAAAGASAQPYPAKPIRVVVPNPAGGYYDVIARTVGQKVGESIGQPMVVENRVGAGGSLGTEFTAKSPPDGYTIMVGGIGPHGIAPSLYANLPYDPVKDFAPIILVATTPNILVVHPSSPIRSVQDLVAAAREKPGGVSYASNGNGTSQHLSAEMFATAMGLKLNHVPFKGSAPAVTAMLGGQLDFAFVVAPDGLAHVRAGKLRAIGVTGAKRAAPLPDVPTLAEAGVPGYEATAWFGYLAPAGTPREIVDRLNAEIAKALESPDVRDRLAPGGLSELPGGTPERFGDLIKSEIAKWSKVVKESGAKID
ncbi:MAG TPA: tripartite tricarboxylate transporter substrate binding protein [Burkholderiales bacterium]|nr:tripartite tricarboxylate transporter substrate binding protein [Burkholderiales bacterium]